MYRTTQGSFPKVEAIAASAFYGCTGFGRLDFPLVTAIDSGSVLWLFKFKHYHCKNCKVPCIIHIIDLLQCLLFR